MFFLSSLLEYNNLLTCIIDTLNSKQTKTRQDNKDIEIPVYSSPAPGPWLDNNSSVVRQTNTHTPFRVWKQQTQIKTRNILSLRVHYTVSDTTHATRHQIASSVCRWPIAAGKRPDPFRTRKLSLLTLMVLQPGGCGRVRNRRHQTTTNNSIQT